MIHLHLSISNPWHKENFKNIWNKTWSLTKNKAFEIEVIRYGYDIVEFNFSVTHRTDHAGVNLTLGFLGYSLHLQVYDGRHWDYLAGDWEKYDS